MTMTAPADDLGSLLAYNRWANARMLAAVRPLPEADYVREVGGGWPSVRATVVHLAGATDAWALRFSGRGATRLPPPDELPRFADAEALLLKAEDSLDALLPSFTPALLAAPFRWRNLRDEERAAPLWAVVRHVVNHATYHRGQISSMVRRLGGTPLPTDLVLWGIEALKEPSS
jgi:uncharacterized damage-inducible protein DinB